MSLLLAGMTILVLGDSHMTQHNLISTLPDDLMQQGAKVYSFGACGMPSGAWMKRSRPSCGSAYRLDRGPIRNRVGVAALTPSLPSLIKKFHPDLIVVVNGDDMAGYKSASIPKAWAWKQITTLTKGIKASGVSCDWVGPPWGREGGRFGKTFTRVKAMSDYLAGIVSPCVYINSLRMSKPGEWRSEDGVHFLNTDIRPGPMLLSEKSSHRTVLKNKVGLC
ncbi:MAG: SGNH/GDSL hydrolase family protein [Gallionella sp.]